MIAENSSMPIIPRFEIEKVAPVYSCGCSRRARAFSANARDSSAISVSDFESASRITGVMRPSSRATATPMCTRLYILTRSPANEAFSSGWRFSAAAVALMMTSLSEMGKFSSRSAR